MQANVLQEVVQRRRNFIKEERCRCIGELTGPLLAHNPLPTPELADDAVLAAVLSRAWEASIRCDCR